MTDLTEQWVNIYKSKKHGSYWTGAFCYKTKEEAVKDLADREHYLTTVNIEDMLQKIENVAKNVANENSQDLTEQWKKGELPEGHYYVKDGENMIAEYLDGYFYNDGNPMTSFSGGVDEVIAPVPSYDELQNMNKAVNECMAANIKLVEQNKQLKEQINKWYLDAINRGTANAVKAVKEFGMPKRIEELVEENAKLKELLKECFIAINEGSYWDRCDVLPKIDQALGEDK